MRSRVPRSTGFTLPEAALVLAVLGTLVAIAVPHFLDLRHRLAVEGAAATLVRALVDARHVAGRRGVRSAVRVDTAAGTVTVVAGADTLDVHRLREVFGVSLTASRDSIAYAPSGLGYGAANVRYVLRSGVASETVTVSRLGRVRR